MKSLICCALGGLVMTTIALPLVAQEPTGESVRQRMVTPWGISSSASSFRNHEEWFPKMAEAGVSTIRLFPEWRGFEPQKGAWHWHDGDRLVKSAEDHQLEINAILMGSPPGTQSVHAFPMDNLDDWAEYVSAVVGRYKNRIRYWEETRKVPAGQPLVLSNAPTSVAGLPLELVQEALANAKLDFPWGGDYSSARAISFQAGLPDQLHGVFPRNRANCPTVTFSDGSTGLLVQGDINHPIAFYAHPSFASFQTRDYHVRVTVRRIAAGNVGMNLRYEVADSQGRSPYGNVGQWFGVSQESTWQTYTWHCRNACFSKMWGYDFVISPEQSVPFAVGKIEVSTVPFE